MTDVDQPAWLMTRVGPPILWVGGLLSFATFLVPGYLRPTLWARVMMLVTAFGALGVGVLLRHVRPKARQLLAIGILADAEVVGAALALAEPSDVRMVAVTFALPAVLVALFVGRRAYLVKLGSTAVFAGALMTLSGETGSRRCCTPGWSPSAPGRPASWCWPCAARSSTRWSSSG